MGSQSGVSTSSRSYHTLCAFRKREPMPDDGWIWQRAHLTAVVKGLSGRRVIESVEMIDFQRSRNQATTAMRLLQRLIGSTEKEPSLMFRFEDPIRKGVQVPIARGTGVLVWIVRRPETSHSSAYAGDPSVKMLSQSRQGTTPCFS